MYNEGILTLSQGGIIWDVCNGEIYFTDISYPGDLKQIICTVTTPWGYLEDVFITEGECKLYRQELNNPFRVHIYIVKVTAINPTADGGTANFKVLSYAYNENILRDVNTPLLIVTHNLPEIATPGSTINYTFRINNNSTSASTLRFLLATNSDRHPSIKSDSQAECSRPLPPINNTSKICWYDDWISGNSSCTDKQINSGAYYDMSGSVTIPPNGGTEYFTLGIFVYTEDYWGTNKPEWVAPYAYQSGSLQSVVSDLCVGVQCDDSCVGNDLWSMKCDPATGLCVQDALKQTNSPICEATHYLDIHIRPNSWYTPQGAADDIVTKLVDIDGAIVNIFSDILDYQYLGTTIYSTSTDVVIRINLKQLSAAPLQALALPLLAKIGIIIIIILSIIILIGIITKWNFGAVEKTYTKEEVGTLLNDTIKEIVKNCETDFANDPVGYALCVKSAITGSTTTLGDFLNDPTITDAGDQAGQQIDRCIAQYNIDHDTDKLKSCVTGQVTGVTNKIADATTPKDGGEDCWIPAPLGGCILSAKTGKTIAIIGGVVIGGILIISLIKKK